MIKKISVIIVPYNSGKFIDECIRSVLKYLPENGELIVFDNFSDDDTVDKVRKLQNLTNAASSRIKLLESAENLGFAKGNNRAVNQSSGEYLFF